MSVGTPVTRECDREMMAERHHEVLHQGIQIFRTATLRDTRSYEFSLVVRLGLARGGREGTVQLGHYFRVLLLRHLLACTRKMAVERTKTTHATAAGDRGEREAAHGRKKKNERGVRGGSGMVLSCEGMQVTHP